MRIHVCGARGSAPAPGSAFARYGGDTSCIALDDGDGRPRLLIDAGSGIRRATTLLHGRPFRGAILLSHLHWDHTHGLPFFRAGDHPEARVDVYMPEQEADPRALLERALSPPHFPIDTAGLGGRWQFLALTEGKTDVEGFEVLALEIPHKGGRTFGFRVTHGGVSIAYLADHHPASLESGRHGFGPYHDAALELAGGADLLIHDAQYLESEWTARGDFGHSTPGYAIGLAEEAGVARVLLFHHDFDRTDAELDVIGQQFAGPSTNVELAYDGQVVDVTSIGD